MFIHLCLAKMATEDSYYFYLNNQWKLKKTQQQQDLQTFMHDVTLAMSAIVCACTSALY